MILINTLYDTVNDLARGDQNGFNDPEEFNRSVNESQLMLVNYYIMRLEETQVIPEALNPFITEEEVAVIFGEVERPISYRFCLEVYAGYHKVQDCATNSVQYLARPLGTNKVGDNEISPIRKSTQTNPRRYFQGDTIRLLPVGAFTKALIRYIRLPIEASYGYVENTTTNQLDYTSAGSQHLEWGEQELPNFLDLLLDKKGIATKDTALIQWASRRKMTENERLR